MKYVVLYAVVSESAPTSPRPPKMSESSDPGVVSEQVTSKASYTHLYTLPVLSSSAPELEGIWTEVKRRMRTTPRSKEEVCDA